jgi:hypothetical protein
LVPLIPELKTNVAFLAANCIYTKRWHHLPTGKDRPKSGDVVLSGDGTVVPAKKGLSVEDDAKLLFGVIFSLRNISRRLGGDSNK